jgi:hypothetical protein
VRVSALLGVWLLLRTFPASALILGGGPPETDCYAAFDVRKCFDNVIDCQDGDPVCDSDLAVNGECAVKVSLCASQNAPGCTAKPVRSMKVKVRPRRLRVAPPPNPPLPAAQAMCGTGTVYTIPVSSGPRRRRAKVRFAMKAIAEGSRRIGVATPLASSHHRAALRTPRAPRSRKRWL